MSILTPSPNTDPKHNAIPYLKIKVNVETDPYVNPDLVSDPNLTKS